MNRKVVELTATTSTSCGGAVGTKGTDTHLHIHTNIYLRWGHRKEENDIFGQWKKMIQ